MSHLKQSYASIRHNPAIWIGKNTACWQQQLMKGICIVNELYSDGAAFPFLNLGKIMIWRVKTIFGSSYKLGTV